MKVLRSHTLTILSGASLSNATQDLREMRVVAIEFPTMTATSCTFQGAHESTDTFLNLYSDAGTEVTMTMASSRHVAGTGAVFDAINSAGFLKVRTGTSGSPTAEGADRSIILILEPR